MLPGDFCKLLGILSKSGLVMKTVNPFKQNVIKFYQLSIFIVKCKLSERLRVFCEVYVWK